MSAQILCLVTAGAGGQDGLRVRRLTDGFPATFKIHELDRTRSRRQNAEAVWSLLTSQSWDLVYQEGSGIGAGLPLIRAARTRGLRYIVSSGDPIGGFFSSMRGRGWGWAFSRYESALYRNSAGFVGWTPYLTGVAIRLGAPRGATVEGAVDSSIFSPPDDGQRRAAKTALGLDPDHLVCGVTGTLNWMPRQNYCYGLELVKMLPHLKRRDVSVLIVGDGNAKGRNGRPSLEAAVSEEMRHRVVFTGRIAEAEVAQALQATDIGFVTQVLDELGQFRLTTKLPEYLASSVAVAMTPSPGFYDYAREAGWALPGAHPASETFHRQCAAWLDRVTPADVETAQGRAPAVARRFFDYAVVRPRFQAFLRDVLEDGPGRKVALEEQHRTRSRP